MPNARTTGRHSKLHPLSETIRNIRATLAGRATGHEKLAGLSDSLPALEAATAGLDVGSAGLPGSEIAYWARRLLRRTSRRPSGLVPIPRERLESLARRAVALFDGMNFRFLYDAQRELLSIGYRLADAEGPGRLDPRTTTCWPPKRGSPASSRSPRATSPNRTGSIWDGRHQRPRRARRCCRGARTMFEYLMPLLVMRSYPDTLLDESCRMVVRRQIEYGERARRALGHLGIRLQRRRPARHLSVQGVRRARASA